ncbi:hypothetical protein J2Z69_000815 [Paenibacillus shirakamiensis]|uniref:SAF domain-containing protein n=1 Tax=Paenibacillus shirakamiensis TaxID=1265935 RepID=A0ABS4JFQ4_9BACL|nr:SAF domain-containing protein [Paenibacillus shirakamiensis]MBP1999796.1 hypothetical protein [Paenibacillus shirakamiensis]
MKMLKMRQRTKHLIFAGIVGASSVTVFFIVYMVLEHIQVQDAQQATKSQYEARFLAFEKEKDRSTVIGWVPNKLIKAGDTFKEVDLKQAEFTAGELPSNWVQLKENILGHTAKVSLEPFTLITESLIYKEKPTTDDLRNKEISFVRLPASLRAKDVIDIRIQFPTGQDYILLSKKKVGQLSSTSMSLTLTEHEILTLSSAVVDAYFHKASIYALTYVEPELQDSAIPTYPANQQVLQLIAKDHNMISRAEQELTSSSRVLLEKDLGNLSPQTISNFEDKQVKVPEQPVLIPKALAAPEGTVEIKSSP